MGILDAFFEISAPDFAPQARFFGKIGRFLPKSAVFWQKMADFGKKIQGSPLEKTAEKKTAEISKSAIIFELVKKFFRQSTQLAELRRFKLLFSVKRHFF